MQDDLSTFWQNKERARTFFYDLLARAERDAYDEDFLTMLAAYRQASCTCGGGEDSPHADIFAAEYLLAQGDAAGAIVCGERAFRLRVVEPYVWDVLTRAYVAAGRYADALVMQGCLVNLCGVPLTLNLPTEILDAHTLARLSVALSQPSYAPFATRMHYAADQGLIENGALFLGEFLPVSPQITPPYYVGVYTEQGMQGDRVWQIDALRSTPGTDYFGGGDVTFELIRGTRVKDRAAICLAPNEQVVLPVLGTVLPVPDVQEAQKLHIQTHTVDDTAWLNVGTPNYFRLDETTQLRSEADFIIGTPICLGHSPARKKCVLNLFVDALPWQVLRTAFAEHMPQTAQFFARGTIFDQHFSVLEYTYPSLPTIETGMYPQHTGIFSEWAAIELREDIITISERARDAGYATSSLMGDGIGIYNGVTRGYDRLVVSPYRLNAYEGVERTIRYLEGCADADHYIFLHFGDVHPWGGETFQISAAAQMQLPLVGRLSGSKEKVTSPYLRPSAFYQTAFWQALHDTDRALGALFAYLTAHYAPEDYLVSLCSDHGVPIFSKEHYIVDTQLTGATWMMRGAGVPEGIVADELTSAVDIYPTLAHLLDFPVDEGVDGVLPRTLGGTGRDITFSNSLFPRKHYHLAARARDYTLCLRTLDPVSLSGTADLARAETAIYPRAHEGIAGYEVDSPALRAFFYPRVRAFLQGIGNNGELFPLPEEI